MKILSVITLLFLAMSAPSLLNAQEKVLVDEDYKKDAVEKLSQLILDNYVYVDVAEKTVKHLKAQAKSGAFKEHTDLEAFANALTETVQFINKDKHMRIRPRRPTQTKENTPERMIEDMLYHHNYRREVIAGFQEARKIEGNIGYLDLRGFAGVDWGAPVADRYMYLLASSDALIIDLRKNGGGDPNMVQYLCSYFFDGKVHLNSLYWRQGDRTDEFWTLEEVGGTKMPDVPLFVLTSPRTFSGAEEFSYNMQTQKRATLVGETTGGGANPGGTLRINAQLGVFVPTGAAINPITKTNWEGVGVVPEVKVPKEEALDKAIELAKLAAEEYRKKNTAKYKKMFAGLQQALDNHQAGDDEMAVLKQVKACTKAGIMSEGDINMMGYELMGRKNSIAAEVLLKVNTILYPNSANTYDSYGEALAANGKIKEAIKSYQKAVEVAEANDDGNLELFKENLEKVKAMSMKK